MKSKYSHTDEHDELVQMHAFTNDHEMQYVGNAVRWFENSTDEEIKALLEGERNDAGHFSGAAAQTVALELAQEIDLALVLAYAEFKAERYTVIVDRLTTSQWIEKHRPQLIGLLLPPE